MSLRHQQHIELIPEHREALTVGVLLTPRADGLRPWDTTMAATRGDQRFDLEHREALERLWGPAGSSQTLGSDEIGAVLDEFERINKSTD